MRTLFALLVLIFSIESASAGTTAVYSLKSWHRFFSYEGNRSGNSTGQDHWVFFEQKAIWNPVFSGTAQIFGYAGNARADLIQAADRMDVRSQVSEVWAGDLYGQIAYGPALLRIGYQQISWQEGFAASFTNFLNPHDNRSSVFETNELIFRSSPMVNLILSGDQLSGQFIFIPYSQLDTQAPASRWGTRSTFTPLAGQTIEIENAAAAKFRNAQEFGARGTWAGSGFDASVFIAHLKDRRGFFANSSDSTFANIKLLHEQSYMTPIGITGSMTTASDWVVRLELLRIANRRANVLSGFTLSTFESGESAFTIGVDSPVGEHFSLVMQHSASVFDQETPGLLRTKVESASFGSMNYTFSEDRAFRLSAIYFHTDQTLLSRLSYRAPITKRAEFELALEGAAGPTTSQGAAIKDLNRVYVQLSHML